MYLARVEICKKAATIVTASLVFIAFVVFIVSINMVKYPLYSI